MMVVLVVLVMVITPDFASLIRRISPMAHVADEVAPHPRRCMHQLNLLCLQFQLDIKAQGHPFTAGACAPGPD